MVYIGQAIDLDSRKIKHKKNISDKTHTEDFYKALREFGWENFSYEVLAEFEEYDPNRLNELETYFIEKYNSIKPNGYNMVPGGSNGAGLAKRKKVLQYDLNGNFIAEYPSAHQAAYATKINFSSICCCCRQEISHTKEFQWKYADDERKIQPIKVKITRRPVGQYDLNYNLLNIYSTLQEANEKTGIAKATISNVCCGKGKTAGGYVWRYLDNLFFVKEKISCGNKKAVLQFDKEGNFIQEYSSITEASKITGINKNNIGSVCSKKRKTAGNFIWKFKEFQN